MTTNLPPKPPYDPGQQQPAWTGPPTNASSGGGAVVVVVVVLGLVILLGLACGVAALGFFLFARAAPGQTVEEWAHAEAVPADVQHIEGSLDLTPTDPARAVWSYPANAEGQSGTLRQLDAGNWQEARSDGVTYEFTEVSRTDDHVELFDQSRQLYVRLYDDRMEWRRSGEWLQGQAGAWQAEAVESPQP